MGCEIYVQELGMVAHCGRPIRWFSWRVMRRVCDEHRDESCEPRPLPPPDSPEKKPSR
jgi:hypothetical protein